MTLPLSYRRILFTTTALVAITLSAPAMATNVTPVTGADDTNPSAGGPPPLATSTSAGGFNFIAGGDNLYNVTGTTVAVTMDSPATLQQVVTLTGSSVTAVNGDTITISEDNAQISIGSGLTLGNTGLGDTIDFGTTDNSPSGNPANININGILSNSGGGQAINASGVTGGTLNVNLNSTTGSLLGDVSFGLGASNLNITGNGTNDTTGTITGGGVGAVDTLNVNLTGAADTLTLGGALTNLDAMNFNSGITTLGGNIVGGGTATVASGAGLNIAGITSVATTGGLDVNGALTTAASTVLNTNLTMTTANGSITGPIQLGAAGYNATLTNGTFNNTITGGLGTDNITLANLDLTGAIDGGAGTDSVNFTGGAHTNTINNIETLTLANAGTTYANGTAITGLTNALTVGAATTLNANNNITGAGSTFTLNGRVNVGATNVITAGTIGTTGANSFYGVSINPASSASNITVNSALAQNLANTRIDVTKPVGQFIAGGAQYNVFTNNGIGALTIPTAAVVDNSFTTNFVASAGGVGANDLLLTAVRANTYNSVSSNDQNSSVGTALEQYATGVATGAIPGNAQLNTIITNLENMGSGQQIDQAIESLTPAVNGIGEASLSMANASLNTIATRLDSFRNETTRGANSGDVNPYLKGGWVQGYGVFGDQGRREGTPGFESNTYGTALGLDTEKLWKDAIVGVAAGYSNTNVNSKSLNNAETDIDSYQVGAYFTKTISPKNYNFFVDGIASFAYNEYDNNRSIAVGGFTANTNGDFDGYQASAKLRAGKDFAVLRPGFVVTPEVSAQYTHLWLNDYTENGAGGASLAVNQDDTDALILGAGARASYVQNFTGGLRMVPEVRAGILYDVIGDDLQTTNNFTGGGPAFNVNGADIAQTSYTVGAGVNLINFTTGVSLRADYDARFREDYTEHNVQARMRVEF